MCLGLSKLAVFRCGDGLILGERKVGLRSMMQHIARGLRTICQGIFTTYEKLAKPLQKLH